MAFRKMVLRIPGQWEDAWLYRETLLLWDCEGDLYFVSVSDLSSQIEFVADHHKRAIAEHLVLRSERKSSREFRDWLAIPGIHREFFAPFGDRPELVITIPGSALRLFSSEPVPGNITDTVAYGNRLFAASDAGVFEMQFSSIDEASSPLAQVVDTPATAVVAGSGQLAASLGEAGLIAREVTFGDGEGWAHTAERTSIERLSSYSRSVSRSSVHLINYGVDPAPEFIRVDTAATYRSNGFKETVITDFHEPISLRSHLQGLVSDEFTTITAAENDDYEVLGNAGHRLLIRFGTDIRVVNMNAFKERQLALKPHLRFELDQLAAPPILYAMSTQQLRSGFLIEHARGIHILNESGIVELTDELVVQARTFPNSRRYVDTVALVREECLDLVGFVEVEDL